MKRIRCFRSRVVDVQAFQAALLLWRSRWRFCCTSVVVCMLQALVESAQGICKAAMAFDISICSAGDAMLGIQRPETVAGTLSRREPLFGHLQWSIRRVSVPCAQVHIGPQQVGPDFTSAYLGYIPHSRMQEPCYSHQIPRRLDLRSMAKRSPSAAPASSRRWNVLDIVHHFCHICLTWTTPRAHQAMRSANSAAEKNIMPQLGYSIFKSGLPRLFAIHGSLLTHELPQAR